MKRVLLLKYGEIVLKGLNKTYFENLLLKRVRRVLGGMGTFEYYYAQSTLTISSPDADLDACAEKLKKVFGVAVICRGISCEKDLAVIRASVRENAAEMLAGAKTFKCVAKRSDKSFPCKSPELCALCGGDVLEVMPHLRVDVENPDVVLQIEIRDRAAFLHGGSEKAAGGMPTGSNGRGMLLLSGGIDSPVAGYMVAKRGVVVDAVYFESPPYTGEAAWEKVTALAKVIESYTGTLYLNRISITEIQQKLVDCCDERLFTILLRRFMMRLARRVAEIADARALITGESIGQVASQTMDAIARTDEAAGMPVFRPCIGMDKEEIVTLSRAIGAFDISSLPYEDCCTVFTPRHPNLRPTAEEVLAEEEKIDDIEGLLERAMKTREVVRLYD